MVRDLWPMRSVFGWAPVRALKYRSVERTFRRDDHVRKARDSLLTIDDA